MTHRGSDASINEAGRVSETMVTSSAQQVAGGISA
jgi:hypothetical protein